VLGAPALAGRELEDPRRRRDERARGQGQRLPIRDGGSLPVEAGRNEYLRSFRQSFRRPSKGRARRTRRHIPPDYGAKSRKGCVIRPTRAGGAKGLRGAGPAPRRLSRPPGTGSLRGDAAQEKVR